MGRTILGAGVGLVVTFFTIMLVEMASHAIYPPPPGFDPTDMTRLVAVLPTGALIFVVVAWLAGAFDGGFVAALIARDGYPRAAAVVPALMVMAGVVAMIMLIPGHPAWMTMAGLLLPIPTALFGAWLAAKGRPAQRR